MLHLQAGGSNAARTGTSDVIRVWTEQLVWTCMAKRCEAPIRVQDYSRVDVVLGPYAERCLHVCGVIISWSIRGIASSSKELHASPLMPGRMIVKKRLKSLFRLAISGEERKLVLTAYCRLSRCREAEKETG